MAIDTKCWLKDYNQVALKNLTLPASHDAAMINKTDNIFNGDIQCHDKSIKEQLEDGIRFLDFRFDKIDKNGYPVGRHGPNLIGSDGINLNKCLKDSINFVTENSSEFVIIRLKWENDTKKPMDRKFKFEHIIHLLECFRLKNNPLIYSKKDLNYKPLMTKSADELSGNVIILFHQSLVDEIEYLTWCKCDGDMNKESIVMYGEYSNKVDWKDILKEQYKKYSTIPNVNERNLNESMTSIYMTSTTGGKLTRHSIKYKANKDEGGVKMPKQWAVLYYMLNKEVDGYSKEGLKNISEGLGVNKIEGFVPGPNLVYIDFSSVEKCKRIINLTNFDVRKNYVRQKRRFLDE